MTLSDGLGIDAITAFEANAPWRGSPAASTSASSPRTRAERRLPAVQAYEPVQPPVGADDRHAARVLEQLERALDAVVRRERRRLRVDALGDRAGGRYGVRRKGAEEALAVGDQQQLH